MYLLSGDRERSDWVRNLQANAPVTVALGDETHARAARVLQANTVEDQRARELLVCKYREGDNLDEWGRTALPVVIEFSADGNPSTATRSPLHKLTVPVGTHVNDKEEYMVANRNGRFEGRVAFITGGSSGIGRATAIAFAREGASVVVTSRSEGQNQDTVRLVEEAGGKALAVTCDVSRSGDLQRALQQTIETFGRLDFAFNNAGVEQPVAALADITEEEWTQLIDIDLGGVFLCMKYQLPLLQQQGGGVIVNTSSGAGVKGFKGQAAYAVAKHGIIGLSKSAALDYAAEKIRINVVAPGIIDTEMMDRFSGGTEEGRQSVIGQEPVGRMGRPEEIAGAALFLCSDDGGYVTGTGLVIDGGLTAR